MLSLRTITLWSALVTLPVPLADAQEAAGKDIPWSCADTSVSRWLTADTAANRSEVEKRELLEHRLART